jgi:hypothetical protein
MMQPPSTAHVAYIFIPFSPLGIARKVALSLGMRLLVREWAQKENVYHNVSV